MHFRVINPALKFRTLTIVIFSILGSTLLSFGQTSISRIVYNNQDYQSANIIIGLPKKSPVQQTVKLNQSFPSGTLFQIPAGVTVFLTSNGNMQRLGPGSKHMVQAGPKGEKHKTFFGRVKHFVKNKLSFYKASGPNNKYQGAVQGTEFTIEAVGKDVKFMTTEGSVEIQRRVPVKVNQQSAVNRTNDRELFTVKKSYVNAGDPEMYYDYEAYEEVTYNSYQDAINQYQSELDQGYYSGADPYYLADEYTLLGGLYLDSGDYAGAIEPWNKALNLWIEIDPYDPLIAEHYLNLAEAHYLAGNQSTGVKYWDSAVTIIDGAYAYYLDEYRYFLSAGDYQTAWAFGNDLLEMYYGLAYAYELRYNLGGEITEDYQNPNFWYNEANALSTELSNLRF